MEKRYNKQKDYSWKMHDLPPKFHLAKKERK